MKYTPENLERIFTLVAEGKHTAKAICDIIGIHYATWFEWMKIDEFSESYKKAIRIRQDNYALKARGGLDKLLDVYTVEEKTVEFKNVKEYYNDENGNKRFRYVPMVLGEKKTVKVFMPNVVAVMYALNNADPENFQHKEHKKITHDGAINSTISKVPFKIVPRPVTKKTDEQ